MVFSSIPFLFCFLPVFLMIYYTIPQRLRYYCLFIFSLAFYGIGVSEHPIHLLILIVSLLVNFSLSQFLSHSRGAYFLSAGILYNLVLLTVCKYLTVFLPNKAYTLPLGISFFTFQNISYLVDAYRSKCAETSFIRFGAKTAMFPKLISGPLVHYTDLKFPVKTKRNIHFGLVLFILGLGLKSLLANRLGGLWKDINTIGFSSISTQLAWLGILTFSLHLYFDFWGYSLMARGLGRMLGFRLPKNFDHPYTALTVSDFWRRWHMSLGSWFRDYVYIPLGGSRTGKLRLYGNLLLVWLLTALWHGSQVNFLLWGIFLFLLIAIEKAGLGKFWNGHPLVAHIYVPFVIGISWLLFAITDITELYIYFSRLVGIGDDAVFTGDFVKYLQRYGVFLFIGILLSTKLPQTILHKLAKRPIFLWPILLLIFLLSVYSIHRGGNDPFLYFNF